jgi:hypothetical protein
MALSPEQRKIVSKLKQIGGQVGASPKEIKAAIETGLVESGLRNLPGGDADSAGWRQERASLYKDPTNLDASIRRFYRETRAVRDKYGRAGDLAAAVQRPAAQYRGRYQGVSGQADRLMGEVSAAPQHDRQAGERPAAAPQVDTGEARRALLGQYLASRGQPGALAALGGGLGDLARAPTPAAPAGEPARRAQAAPASQGSGTFKITGPNPKRLKPQLVSFARQVAGVYGKPIVGSDGTGHSYRTVNGGVSQHSTGNATDIPASGRELVRMGRAALIAAGMPRAQAMKQKGGLYNVGKHQIIFATTQGGNHYDHLHISAK